MPPISPDCCWHGTTPIFSPHIIEHNLESPQLTPILHQKTSVKLKDRLQRSSVEIGRGGRTTEAKWLDGSLFSVQNTQKPTLSLQKITCSLWSHETIIINYLASVLNMSYRGNQASLISWTTAPQQSSMVVAAWCCGGVSQQQVLRDWSGWRESRKKVQRFPHNLLLGQRFVFQNDNDPKETAETTQWCLGTTLWMSSSPTRVLAWTFLGLCLWLSADSPHIIWLSFLFVFCTAVCDWHMWLNT